MALLCVSRIGLAIIFGRFFPDPFKIDSAVHRLASLFQVFYLCG